MSIIKIAITGPESSGKTKLAEDIAVFYDALMVPEYARDYLEQNGPSYTEDQFIEMAIGQQGQMNFYENLASEMIIYDTEMLVYKIWGEFKYEKRFEVVEEAWVKQEADLYLLCKPDLEWEDDILRENKDNRDSLFLLYQSELNRIDRNYTIIDGQGDQRFQKAKDEIDALLEN